ncbi:MAG: NAD(P)H-hydrate dehydratase, partial [Thiohalocapsa sp.]
ARLLGLSIADVEGDRFAAVAALQRRFDGVTALKGAGTLIKGPGHRPIGLCSDGNSGMASAGMGDTLTGIIAALIAQGRRVGQDPEQAASTGVCLHAAAGDLAARVGQRGMLASDLIDALRVTLAQAGEGD